MRSVARIIVGLIAGTLTGALCGALILGVQVYMDTSSSKFGPSRNWAGVVAIMGAVCGAVPGLVIGLIIGVGKIGKGYGALIGAAFGFAIAVYLLSITTPRDEEVRLAGALSVPAGALVGLIAASFVGLLRKPRLP
jgi:hypothetical protein